MPIACKACSRRWRARSCWRGRSGDGDGCGTRASRSGDNPTSRRRCPSPRSSSSDSPASRTSGSWPVNALRCCRSTSYSLPYRRRSGGSGIAPRRRSRVQTLSRWRDRAVVTTQAHPEVRVIADAVGLALAAALALVAIAVGRRTETDALPFVQLVAAVVAVVVAAAVFGARTHRAIVPLAVAAGFTWFAY